MSTFCVDDDGPGVAAGCIREGVRAFLHRSPAPGLRAEFRSWTFHLQTNRRRAWRHYLGGKSDRRAGRGRRCDRRRRALCCAPAGNVMADLATVHASAVLVGARAVLIRGPSASGKSRLALELLEAAAPAFCALLGLSPTIGSISKPPAAVAGAPRRGLAGLIEVRGAGLLRLAHEPCAVVGLVVDLAAPDAGSPARRRQRKTKSMVSHCRGLPSQPTSQPCRRCWPSLNFGRGVLGFSGDGSLVGDWLTLTPLDSIEPLFCHGPGECRSLAALLIRNSTLRYRNAAAAGFRRKCLLRLGFGWSR